VGAGSTLDLCLAPSGEDYALILDAKTELGPTTVPVLLGGHPLGSVTLDSPMTKRMLPVSAAQLRWGHNLVELRYPRPFQPAALDARTNDQRLLGVMVSSLMLVPVKALAALDVASNTSAFASGWGAPEPTERGSALWSTGPKSVVKLTLSALPVAYRLELEVQPIVRAGGLVVSVLVNGRKAPDVHFKEEGWQVTSVRIPRGLLSPGANDIEFDYSRTVRPHDENSSSQDTRELALRVRRVDLAPAVGP
jgi:hypothetical protein